MNKHAVCIFLLVTLAMPLQAQQRGLVQYPFLGIQFTIPEGWYGGEDGEMYLMGSDTDSGLLGVMLNAAKSTADLKIEAEKGIISEGVQLAREGNYERVGLDGLGTLFSGYFHGQKARAYAIGLINPFGQSITIIALTSAESYSLSHKKLAHEIADSMGFAMPEDSPITQDWQQNLKGMRLAYRNSSYSSSADYSDASGQSYGSYSSSSETVNMDLCGDGRFSFYSSSSASFDSSGGFGSLGSSDDNVGTWGVTTLPGGEGLLTLVFGNGQISEYELSSHEGKVMLNGSRYYRVDSEFCS